VKKNKTAYPMRQLECVRRTRLFICGVFCDKAPSISRAKSFVAAFSASKSIYETGRVGVRAAPVLFCHPAAQFSAPRAKLNSCASTRLRAYFYPFKVPALAHLTQDDAPARN
jgi:hypothetical protein